MILRRTSQPEVNSAKGFFGVATDAMVSVATSSGIGEAAISGVSVARVSSVPTGAS